MISMKQATRLQRCCQAFISLLPAGWAGNPQLFDAARFWQARCFGGDKPPLQQKTPKTLQMTHERWQTTVWQVDGKGGRELPSKQTVLLVLEVLMVKMKMQGRSWAAYSHHPSLGYPFLPAPYFPIAEHLPASPRGSCTQPARKPGRKHSTPSLEHPHHG